MPHSAVSQWHSAVHSDGDVSPPGETWDGDQSLNGSDAYLKPWYQVLMDLNQQVGAIVAAQEKAWYSIAAIETSTEHTASIVSKLLECHHAPTTTTHETSRDILRRGSIVVRSGMTGHSIHSAQGIRRSPTLVLDTLSDAKCRSGSSMEPRVPPFGHLPNVLQGSLLNLGENSHDSLKESGGVLPSQWPGCIELRQSLTEENMSQSVRMSRHLQTNASRRTMSFSEGSYQEEVYRCGKGFDPDGRLIMAMDWVSLVVLMYDVLVTPYMLAWDLEITLVMAVLAAGSATFWTVRMVLAFQMGFYHKGELVLDRSQIARRYFWTTFPFDFCIVLADWLVLIFNNIPVLRFTGLLRLAKVVRLANAMTLLEKLLEAAIPRSKLLMRVCQVIASLVVFTHLMSCFWYAVGRASITDTDRVWLEVFSNEDLPYPYLTAFHWTLAQVTLGATEINPTNSAERAFAIMLLIFGMLFSATIIAFISSETMEYVSTRRENLQMMWELKLYLRQNQVDGQLATRIKRQISERLWHSDQPLSEDDVEPAIKLLSTTLRADLKRETRLPHLMTHALFQTWRKIDVFAIRRLSDEGVNFAAYKTQDNIFIPGEKVGCAFFITTGKLKYVQDTDTSFEKVDTKHELDNSHYPWVCEASLWTDWTTVGCLDAETGCKLLMIEADVVIKVLPSHPMVGYITRHYAQAYHLRVTAARPPFSRWPSDIFVPDTQSSDLLSNDVGLELLRQEHKRGRLDMSSEQFVQLENEVKEEKCSIQEGPTGRLERIVPLVVLKITRPQDGRILLEVGTWTKDGGLRPGAALPAAKRRKGELLRRAVQRKLDMDLSVFLGGLKWMEVEDEDKVMESEKYKMMTKYIRNVQNMELNEDFEEPMILQPCKMFGTSGRSSRQSVRITAPLLYDPFVDDQKAQEVLPIESDGRIRLYSWVKASTLDFFCPADGMHNASKTFLADWLNTIDTTPFEETLKGNRPTDNSWNLQDCMSPQDVTSERHSLARVDEVEKEGSTPPDSEKPGGWPGTRSWSREGTLDSAIAFQNKAIEDWLSSDSIDIPEGCLLEV